MIKKTDPAPVQAQVPVTITYQDIDQLIEQYAFLTSKERITPAEHAAADPRLHYWLSIRDQYITADARRAR